MANPFGDAAWHAQGEDRRAELFGPATDRMLDLVDLRSGDRVIDLAAGAGGQAVAAARRVGPTGSVLATDINADLLAQASATAARLGLPIETRLMDAEAIDLTGPFDAGICRLGLMFLHDPTSALARLRPLLGGRSGESLSGGRSGDSLLGGRFGAIVFSTPEANPTVSRPLAITRRIAGLSDDGPAIFSLAAPGLLERVLLDAGYSNVTVEPYPLRRQFASAVDALADMRRLFPVLNGLMATLPEDTQDLDWDAIATDLKQFEEPNGFDAPGEVLIAVGTASPH